VGQTQKEYFISKIDKQWSTLFQDLQ